MEARRPTMTRASSLSPDAITVALMAHLRVRGLAGAGAMPMQKHGSRLERGFLAGISSSELTP